MPVPAPMSAAVSVAGGARPAEQGVDRGGRIPGAIAHVLGGAVAEAAGGIQFVELGLAGRHVCGFDSCP